MSQTIVILGNTPSKKNNKQLVFSGGHPRFIPNKVHQVWEKDALWQLKTVQPVANYPVSISIDLYFKDQRKRDIDNCCTSITDALVKANIITDDSYQYMQEAHVYFCGVDKENPRAEITIKEVKHVGTV